VIVVIAERPTATEPGFIGSDAHARLERIVEASIPLGFYLVASPEGGWPGGAAQAQADALLSTLRAARNGAPLGIVALGGNVGNALGLHTPGVVTWWKGVRLAWLPGLSRRDWWAVEAHREKVWSLWRSLEAVGP